ncbi:hypothetical protein [Stygiobacter electus]|uniref:Uncharacterized protein n=1 Tax=Stygiobacter electus TaxID=3032292 RepID=A0AAE3P3H1_9BACT|nr:hypothetical protein [Stygiobacter electus]MDF1613117.1 hypothetical protein [Stygiobacter electus]
MLTSKKRWFTGIAAVIAVLVVSVVLFAQEHPKKNNSMDHTYDLSYRNSNVPEKYWLTDEQISQANKIKKEYDELIQPEIEKLNTVRGYFSDYQQQDDINSKRIREYQSEIRGIEDNIYSLKMEAGNKIKKVLNKSQRKYYNDSVFNGWCDGWTWDYNGYMDYGLRNHGYTEYGWGCGYMDSETRNHGRMYSHGGCW